MGFNRYFITSSYALFIMSFVMLVATGQVDAVTIVMFAGSLTLGWLIDSGKLSWAVSAKFTKSLWITYLAFVLFEWQILKVNPISIIIHFILFSSSLKLLRIKTNRDWLWLYIVSFCQVLMVAGMMISTTFLLLLILYLFTAITTFVSYEIRCSQQRFEASISTNSAIAQPQPIDFWKEDINSRRRLTAPRWRSLTYFSSAVLVLILVLSVPIFLAMPRLSRGASHRGFLATETLMGFSDSVRLGEMGQVKLNPQIVMRVRVRFPNEGGRQILRWRGVTLDDYDGHIWSRSGEDPAPIKKITESFRVEEKPSPHGFTHQHFFVEPLNINTVFAAPRPVYVSGLAELWHDNGDGLWTEHHPYHKIDYTVLSDTYLPTDNELIADNSRAYPKDIRQRYFQLPSDHDRRINDLAAEIIQGATTQLEIARKIEEHLRNSYSYSLNLQGVEDGDPVADFLFNVRAGHCEYFASAMVLMLRTRNVPARLVNGFQMGEYNRSADVYTVRQSDAHSWVEVYFPKHGWVTFDPTPAAGLSTYDNGMMAWLRHYSEAIEMYWLEHIIGFDTGKQLSMAISVQKWLWAYQRKASSRWVEWAYDLAKMADAWRINWQDIDRGILDGRPSPDTVGTNVPGTWVFPLAGLVGLIMTSYVWRKYSSSWRRKVKGDAQGSAVAFYQEMLRLLERGGCKREPSQTPAEFASRLSIPAVTEITRLYNRTRFGNEQLTENEIAQIDILLRGLKNRERLRKR